MVCDALPSLRGYRLFGEIIASRKDEGMTAVLKIDVAFVLSTSNTRVVRSCVFVHVYDIINRSGINMRI
jgi:hypothetical protein